MILDWIAWLVYGAAVVGLAKLLNATALKKAPPAWVRWALAAAMFVVSFFGLFILKVALGKPGSPFDTIGLAVLFAALFFVFLKREAETPPS